MVMKAYPTYFTFLTNGACAVRERNPVRMLQMNPQKANASDVNDAQPYLRTTYANNVKREKFDAVPTSIPNIGTPHLRLIEQG